MTGFGGTQNVTGYVDVELFKGSASIRARSSPLSLYSEVRAWPRQHVACVRRRACALTLLSS